MIFLELLVKCFLPVFLLLMLWLQFTFQLRPSKNSTHVACLHKKEIDCGISRQATMMMQYRTNVFQRPPCLIISRPVRQRSKLHCIVHTQHKFLLIWRKYQRTKNHPHSQYIFCQHGKLFISHVIYLGNKSKTLQPLQL